MKGDFFKAFKKIRDQVERVAPYELEEGGYISSLLERAFRLINFGEKPEYYDDVDDLVEVDDDCLEDVCEKASMEKEEILTSLFDELESAVAFF